MTTAITWVLVNPSEMFRYIVLDRVVLVVELDIPDRMALAEHFPTVAKAHAMAARYTDADERRGFSMSGRVRAIDTDLDPEMVAWAYKVRQPIQHGLRVLLARLDQGEGVFP